VKMMRLAILACALALGGCSHQPDYVLAVRDRRARLVRRDDLSSFSVRRGRRLRMACVRLLRLVGAPEMKSP